ncbi:MAG: hypothetical protein FH748_06795 [Balneolaceae bacterium]|nr:hypothetical protein [Balneolaceae bacterium]
MKHLFLLLPFLLISCSNTQQDNKTSAETDTIELLDIRVHSSDQILVRGKLISSTALKPQLKDIPLDSSSTVRVLFNKSAPWELMNDMQSAFQNRLRLNRANFIALSSSKIEAYKKKYLHIDVLANGNILLRGKEIHPDDLRIALNSTAIDRNITILLSVSDGASSGTVADVRAELKRNEFLNITQNKNRLFKKN